MARRGLFGGLKSWASNFGRDEESGITAQEKAAAAMAIMGGDYGALARLGARRTDLKIKAAELAAEQQARQAIPTNYGIPGSIAPQEGDWDPFRKRVESLTPAQRVLMQQVDAVRSGAMKAETLPKATDFLPKDHAFEGGINTFDPWTGRAGQALARPNKAGETGGHFYTQNPDTGVATVTGQRPLSYTEQVDIADKNRERVVSGPTGFQAYTPPPLDLPESMGRRPGIIGGSAPAMRQPTSLDAQVPHSDRWQGMNDPAELDALTRMLVTEAANQGPEGMAAAAHVALTRAKAGSYGGRTLRDVVYAKNQFEGMSRAGTVDPNSPQYQAARQIAEGVIAGQIPDPTGGATNFINPELQAQLGRRQPAWAPGNGHRIGDHVFYGGQPPGAAIAGGSGQDRLGGGPAGDTLRTPGGGTLRPMGPQVAPYRPPVDRYEQVNPQQQVNRTTGKIEKVDPATLAPRLQDAEDADLAAYDTLKSAAGRAGQFRQMLQDGTLNLGPAINIINDLRNKTGFGNADATNYAEFKTFTEQLRNDILMLHKGVQTEGDAKRAMNTIVQSFGDERAVKAALGRLEELNMTAAQRRYGYINHRRTAQGVPALPMPENDPLGIRRR